MSEFAYVLRYKEDIVFHQGTDRERVIPAKGQYYPKGSSQVSTPHLFAARMYKKMPTNFENGNLLGGSHLEAVAIRLEALS